MPSAGRLVKEAIIRELSEHVAEHPNFFVTAMSRLKASEADILRRQLHVQSSELLMIKRRLSLRVADQLQIPGLHGLFEGSVGFVLTGEDPLTTAKVVVEFVKTHQDQLAVRGGVLDGQLVDRLRVEHLASLPAKPVLLANVVGMVQAPLVAVLSVVERVIGDIAWIVEQIAESKTKEGPAPKTEATTAEAQADDAPQRAMPSDVKPAGQPRTPAAPAGEARPMSTTTTPHQEEHPDAPQDTPKQNEPPTSQEGA